MDFKKIVKRGVILALVITLISLVGMGVIDFVFLAVGALIIFIAAGISTIVHNQRVDK